jgi:hypothetical protein
VILSFLSFELCHLALQVPLLRPVLRFSKDKGDFPLHLLDRLGVTPCEGESQFGGTTTPGIA